VHEGPETIVEPSGDQDGSSVFTTPYMSTYIATKDVTVIATRRLQCDLVVLDSSLFCDPRPAQAPAPEVASTTNCRI
jgi:hypothetical protein